MRSRSPRPRARYRVTTPTKVAAFLKRMLPTRAIDRIVGAGAALTLHSCALRSSDTTSRSRGRFRSGSCSFPRLGPREIRGVAGAIVSTRKALRDGEDRKRAPLTRPPRRLWAHRHPRSGTGRRRERLIRHPVRPGTSPLGRGSGPAIIPALKVSLVLTAGRNAGGRLVGASRPVRVRSRPGQAPRPSPWTGRYRARPSAGETGAKYR